MIITIKNLQQQTFHINFDPHKTVLELKKQICVERGGEYTVEKQKLIYAGVILTDDRTLNSYKVDEKKFIVVMLTRDISASTGSNPCASTSTTQSQLMQSKPTTEDKTDLQKLTQPINPSTVCQTSESKNKSSQSDERENKDAIQQQKKDSDKATEAQVASSAEASGTQSSYSSSDLVGELANASLQSHAAESNLLMGDEYNRTVASMIEMGYMREQVELAMAASFNNPERAVEYLINGIPEDEDLFNARPVNEQLPLRASAAPIDELSQASELSTSNVTDTADPFEFLRSQPQFLQMRSLIYQNPHLLHAVLQQIGQTNPALLQLISENQDAFLNMLNQPLEGEAGGNNQRTSQTRASLSHRSGSPEVDQNATLVQESSRRTDGGAQNDILAPVSEAPNVNATDDEERTEQPGSTTIRLSTRDRDAIERLKALGFPEALVLQAYFACEKDEELAANFLLSSSFDD